jgi:hypothetical protein
MRSKIKNKFVTDEMELKTRYYSFMAKGCSKSFLMEQDVF